MKRARYCQIPATMSVMGRSSSITNAFINAIIPVIEPTEAEELEALCILSISPDNICCAYCGDKATEWDHLRAIISNQEPTGYITEIANLVPACERATNLRASLIGARGWKETQSFRPKHGVCPISKTG